MKRNEKVQETRAETREISNGHREKNLPKEWLSTRAGHLGGIQSSTRQDLEQGDLA